METERFGSAPLMDRNGGGIGTELKPTVYPSAEIIDLEIIQFG